MTPTPTRFTRLEVLGAAGVLSALVVAGVSLGVSTQDSGVKILQSTEVIHSPGGMLPIYGALTLTPTSGTIPPRGGSGTLSIQNPYDKTLLCESPIIRVTTAPTSPFTADIWTATGSITQVTNSGSYLLRNNFSFAAGVHTLTGSQVSSITLTKAYTGAVVTPSVGGVPWRFVLHPRGTTASVTHVNIKSLTGTGHGLVGTYHIPCLTLE